MKKLIIILIITAFLIPVGLKAQTNTPNEIRYSGTLTDASGNILEGMKNLRFRLYNSFTGGTQLWSDTFLNVEVIKGSFSVIFGSNSALPSGLPNELFVQIEIQRSDSTWEVFIPRVQILGSIISYETGSSTGAGSCPQDMVWTGHFCIDRKKNGSRIKFLQAIDYCALAGKRLCRSDELANACRFRSNYGINDMGIAADYTDYEFSGDRCQKGKGIIPNIVTSNWYVTGFNCSYQADVRTGKYYLTDGFTWCVPNGFEDPEWCFVKAFVRCCK